MERNNNIINNLLDILEIDGNISKLKINISTTDNSLFDGRSFVIGP